MKIKTIIKRVVKVVKYTAIIVVAIAIIGFADENSAWNHYRNTLRIQELEEEIAALRDAYSRDTAQIHALDTDPKAVERAARERYFMHHDDEDVFVLYDRE